MFTKAILATIGIFLSINAVSDNKIPNAPSWSTPARGTTKKDTSSEKLIRIEASNKSYTQKQIDDKFNAPDWFPQEHLPMPNIVKHGKSPKVWACASCHLASGLGHPESSTLAGLSEAYMVDQLKAFSDGRRVDYTGHMNRFAPLLSEKEIIDASKWFASLKYQPFTTVIETKTVATTYIDETRMRHIKSKNKTEPIGNRIIEVPVEKEAIEYRSPRGKFITFVPEGSIKRGKNLVTTGDNGKTLQCVACHGAKLEGGALGPAIVGNFGIYTVRQLHGFKAQTRKSPLMLTVVQNLTDKDIVDISAYLSSLSVEK